MQNGLKTVSTRQSKPAASFAARQKRWTSNVARAESDGGTAQETSPASE